MAEREVERRMRKAVGSDTYNDYQKTKAMDNPHPETSHRVNIIGGIETRVRDEVRKGVNTLLNDDGE
jgi:hypothetical protein